MSGNAAGQAGVPSGAGGRKSVCVFRSICSDMPLTTEDLISAVLARPPLWNSSDSDHSNRQVIKKLWKEIKIISGDSDGK